MASRFASRCLEIIGSISPTFISSNFGRACGTESVTDMEYVIALNTLIDLWLGHLTRLSSKVLETIVLEEKHGSIHPFV